MSSKTPLLAVANYLRRLTYVIWRYFILWPAFLIGLSAMINTAIQSPRFGNDSALNSVQAEAHRWQDAPRGKVLDKVCEKSVPEDFTPEKTSHSTEAVPASPLLKNCKILAVDLNLYAANRFAEKLSAYLLAVVLTISISFILHGLKTFTESFLTFWRRRFGV